MNTKGKFRGHFPRTRIMGTTESKPPVVTPITSEYLYPEHVAFLLSLFKDRLEYRANPSHPPSPSPSPVVPHAILDTFLAFLELPVELRSFAERLFLAMATPSTPTQSSNSTLSTQINNSVAPRSAAEATLSARSFVFFLGVLFRGPPSLQLAYLFTLYARDGVLGEADLRALLVDSYRLAIVNLSLFLDDSLGDPNIDANNELISAFCHAVPFPLDREKFLDFAGSKFPNATKIVEFFVAQKFFKGSSTDSDAPKSASESAKALFPPLLVSSTSSSLPSPVRLVWSLSLFTDVASPVWKILYTNSQHGRSFNRLTSQIFGYGGPTLLLLRTPKKELFGAFVTTPWQSKAIFREDYSCFIFSLLPQVAVFRTSGVDANHVYLYSAHKPQIKLPNGIGFGGQLQSESFRLWIDESLEFGTSRGVDSSFAHGSACPSGRFEIDTLEVWGCGGSQADLEQNQAKNRDSKMIEKGRKVNRQMAANGGNDWTSGPDKFMMDLVGKTGQADAFLDDVAKIKEARATAANNSAGQVEPAGDD